MSFLRLQVDMLTKAARAEVVLSNMLMEPVSNKVVVADVIAVPQLGTGDYRGTVSPGDQEEPGTASTPRILV